MYKQIIIVRKDLKMSVGKLSAQISHASQAFLTNAIRKNAKKSIPCINMCDYVTKDKESISKSYSYTINLDIDKDLYEQWIDDSFTKVVLQARNRNQLLKAKVMAEELGMKEGEDFFLIRDNCYTELTPEEFDEKGVGRTLTCIGFKPMDENIINQISKKYHLYM